MKKWRKRISKSIAVLLSAALILSESGTVSVRATEISQEVTEHTEELSEDKQPDSEVSENGGGSPKTEAAETTEEEKSGSEAAESEEEQSESEGAGAESGKEKLEGEEGETEEEEESEKEKAETEEEQEESEGEETEEEQEESEGEETEEEQKESEETEGDQEESGETGQEESVDEESMMPGDSEQDITVASIEDEDQTDQEGIEYVLGRPMTEEEKEEQIRLMEEYTSHLTFFEPDEKVDRVLDDRQDMARDAQLPTAYDSRDYGYITSVKNQGPLGTCWAFSSVNMAEASLIKNGLGSKDNVDLSEYHMAYYTYRSVTDPLGGTQGDQIYTDSLDTILNQGGLHSWTSNTMLAWRGAVSESTAPYPSDLASAPELPNSISAAYGQNVALLKNTREIHKEDVSLIKQTIMEWGAVGIYYYSEYDKRYYNVDTASRYCDQDIALTHAVSIVGWNDNYSIDNFITKPSRDGAWLVKNSWGEQFGKDGYFWLSYEDATIYDTVFAFDMTTAGAYDNNYQYDGAAENGTWGMQNRTIASNVFTTHANEGRKEILKAVSFATGSVNTDYSIQIYKNPMDLGNPESGTAAWSVPQMGNAVFSGTHTIDLKSPIELDQGDIFAVVVTLYKNDSKPLIRVEWSSRDYEASALPGCSFCKSGNSWYDSGKNWNVNFRIKAYTVNTDQKSEGVRVTGIQYLEEELSSTIKTGETKQFTASVIPWNAVNNGITWSSSDTSVATVDKNGKVTGNKPGKTTVTAKTDDGNYSVEYQVEVIPKKGDEYTYKNVLYKVLTFTNTEGTAEAICAAKKSITSVNVPDVVKINGYSFKVVSVKSSAFTGCTKLKTAKLGKNVASIGKNAFNGCTALTSVNIPASVKKLEDSTFSGCKKLKTVSGCAGITSIENKVFYKCEKLLTVGSNSKVVTLKKVKTIGSSAFYGCKAVKKVNLTSTALTKIGNSAFQECTSMTSFTSRSAKLSSVGKKAFYGDKKLGTISLKTEKLKKSKVGSNAFKGIKSACKFKVPKKQVSSYKTIFKAKGAGSKFTVSKL